MRLTRKQQEILDLLRDAGGRFARPPTLDELCGVLGLSSRGSLHKHVQALVAAGLVEPMHGKHRGIRLVADYEETPGLPYLGRIAAGRPIEAVPQAERMEVPASLRTERPCYVLQVAGDSMIEAGILDGDFVVIEARSHAGNGDVVVALVRGEEVTLKRIEQRLGTVILHPENRSMVPIELLPEEVEIQGVLVGQMRTYKN